MKEQKNNIEDILNELDFNDEEKKIFNASIRETKYAQLDDSIDAKENIFEMIRKEFE